MKFIDIAAKQVDIEAQRMLSDLRDVRVRLGFKSLLV